MLINNQGVGMNTKVASVIIGSTQAAFQKDDSISLAIWKVMNDYKGRTADEIVNRLAVLDHDAGDVRSIIKLLNTAGWFESGGARVGNNTIYTLRKGIAAPTDEEEQAKVSLRKFTSAEVPVFQSADMITREDSVDLAIWKCMKDRNARTATDIGNIIAEFGFDRTIIKDRAITLMRRGWFTRKETSDATYYTLKKGIPMPVNKTKAEPVVGPAAKMETKPSTTPPQKQTRVLSVPGKARAVRAASSTPAPAKPSPAAFAPKASDGVATCIWKVMSDHKPYGRSDVGLLLEEVGINPGTTKVKITELDRLGWFDVTTNAGGRGQLYTLRKGIAMPLNEEPYAPKKTKTTTAEPTSVSEKKETTMEVKAPIALVLPAQEEIKELTAAAEIPLVEVCVKIKGESFSFAEANEIANALKQAGYDAPLTGQVSTLVDVSISIGGKSYTRQEAMTVLQALKNAGFGAGNRW